MWRMQNVLTVSLSEAIINDDTDDYFSNAEDILPLSAPPLPIPPTTSSCCNAPGVNDLPRIGFGCRWDSVDYSCSYDCIFTIFTWIYIHATHSWREKWVQESPMAAFLSGHFEKVLSGMSGPTPNRTVPTLLAEGRDAWRDVLSQHNPTEFPRRG